MEQNQFFLHNKSGNGLINNLKVLYAEDGDSTLPPRRIHLRHSIVATKQRLEVNLELGFVANIILDWTVKFPFSSLFRDVISLAGNLISWQTTGGCRQTHQPRTTFSHTVVTQTCFYLFVRVYSRRLTSMHLHGSGHEAHCLRFAKRKKTFTPHPRRAMSYTLQDPTPRTGTPSSPFPESVFQQPEQPCKDQQLQQSGALKELPPSSRTRDTNCTTWSDEHVLPDREDCRAIMMIERVGKFYVFPFCSGLRYESATIHCQCARTSCRTQILAITYLSSLVLFFLRSHSWISKDWTVCDGEIRAASHDSWSSRQSALIGKENSRDVLSSWKWEMFPRFPRLQYWVSLAVQVCVGQPALRLLSMSNQYRRTLAGIWSVPWIIVDRARSDKSEKMFVVSRTSTWQYVPNELDLSSWEIQLVDESVFSPYFVQFCHPIVGWIWVRNSDTQWRIWEHVNVHTYQCVYWVIEQWNSWPTKSVRVLRNLHVVRIVAVVWCLRACICRCTDCINPSVLGNLLFIATRLKCSWSLLSQNKAHNKPLVNWLQIATLSRKSWTRWG